jgi:alkylation response protein AidB-like acyl-CoA dehydrogenase
MPMTFDLSPELVAAQARARQVAATVVLPAAADIDATGEVPPAVRAALDPLGLHAADPLASVVMIEEIATASPSAAASAGLGVPGDPGGLAGLRGVPRVGAAGEREYLAMAAVCLGIGRAALAEAIRVARARGDRPGGEPAAPPHWALADAATDVDGARLLLHASARGGGLSAAAVMVHAAGAAARALDAALRIVGAEGYRVGSVLERCARDVRSAPLVVGTEDEARRIAADVVLA